MMGKPPQPHHTHNNCNENPKGFLRRMSQPITATPNQKGRIKSTPYFICDCCEAIVILQQVELK